MEEAADPLQHAESVISFNGCIRSHHESVLGVDAVAARGTHVANNSRDRLQQLLTQPNTAVKNSGVTVPRRGGRQRTGHRCGCLEMRWSEPSPPWPRPMPLTRGEPHLPIVPGKSSTHGVVVLEDIGDEVVVGQHDTLHVAGGPGGEADGAQRIPATLSSQVQRGQGLFVGLAYNVFRKLATIVRA
jgi:hypothetical protein